MQRVLRCRMLGSPLLWCSGVAASLAGAAGCDTASCDTDADQPCDTACGLIWYAGDAQTNDGTFVSGHFGYVLTDSRLNALCAGLSEWSSPARHPKAAPRVTGRSIWRCPGDRNRSWLRAVGDGGHGVGWLHGVLRLRREL
ncbi:MAG: hypothetical protein EXR69_15710 [Myxococcales bacterium]|nr:hypothetical protein [Myxococcales bacterium]